MRFFCYTLGDENVPIPPPSEAEMAVMGGFIGEAMHAGVLIATGGFAPTSEGVKVQYSAAGSFTVTDGPFAEAKELIGGWALIETASKEEAIILEQLQTEILATVSATVEPTSVSLVVARMTSTPRQQRAGVDAATQGRRSSRPFDRLASWPT